MRGGAPRQARPGERGLPRAPAASFAAVGAESPSAIGREGRGVRAPLAPARGRLDGVSRRAGEPALAAGPFGHLKAPSRTEGLGANKKACNPLGLQRFQRRPGAPETACAYLIRDQLAISTYINPGLVLEAIC